MFGVGHIQSSKICYLAGRDCIGHMQMKFVIELIILHSVLKIFCPALPFKCSGVSEIHGQTSEVSSPTPEQVKKLISIYVLKQLVFEVQPNKILTSVL